MKPIFINEKGKRHIDPNEIGSLFVCNESCELILPPIEKARGFHCEVLPVGDAEVKLSGANRKTFLDAGNGDKLRFTFSGQYRFGVVQTQGKYVLAAGSLVGNDDVPDDDIPGVKSDDENSEGSDDEQTES